MKTLFDRRVNVTKVKYVHFSEPKKLKTYDTKVALKKNPFFRMTQEEFDKLELANMERDKQKKYILSYEVMERKSKL